MTPSKDNAGVDRSDILFTLILTGTLGIASFLILPTIVIGMVSDLGFTERQVGNAATGQLMGLATGSFLNLVLVRRFDWRRIAYIGVLGLIVGDLASVFGRGFPAFLACRFAAGVGGGIAISFAAYALGNTREPDRNFGWFLSFQVGFAILSLVVMPKVVDAHGIGGVFVTLLVLEVATALALLPRLPSLLLSAEGPSSINSTRVWILCGAVLLGIVFFYIALGGFWTYIAPIGIAGGLSEAATGTALSIGLVGGLVGAYTAASVNVRFGRALPLAVAISSQCLALLILFTGFTFWSFIAAACLFCFGWYMLFPYQLGLLAALDRDGRPLILSNALAGVGSGLGPLLVSLFLAYGFTAAYVICFLFLLLTLVLTGVVIFTSAGSLKTAAD